MWNQAKNLSVTLGGWLFPKDVTNLWAKENESLSSSVEWNNNNNNYYSKKLHGKLPALIIW